MTRRKSQKMQMPPELVAYWQNSISASVCRDYAAGRVTTITLGADGSRKVTPPAPRPPVK